MRRHRPAVVVVLGGHASFACGVGAVLARRPLVLLEQNVRAGAVNRVLRRFATASAVSFEGTDLPRATVTGNPLRPEIAAAAAATATAAAACAELGLPADRIVIGVFSGSLGSRRINEAVRGLVERWSRPGRPRRAPRGRPARLAGVRRSGRRPRPCPGRLLYRPVEYEDRMHLLLQAVDVAVTRAGGSVAELAALGVPAVLVPLPIATRDHQTANGMAVARRPAARSSSPTPTSTSTGWPPSSGRSSTTRPAGPPWRPPCAAAARPDAADRVAELVESVARPALGTG